MRRLTLPERPGWRARAAAEGFAHHSADGRPYWCEGAAYAFTPAEIDAVEAAAAELHALALEFAARAARDEGHLRRLGIPPAAWDAVAGSWARRDPSLYGRFDLAFDGAGPPKLLEYNADTPTALYETGAFQWFWLEDHVRDGRLTAGADQFNAVHERLVARLGQIVAPGGDGALAFAADAASAEDLGTVAYLADCAAQAGRAAHVLDVGAVGLGADGRFRTDRDEPVAWLFKLYPWEWAFRDPFGAAVAASPTRFLEPPWKWLLSGKGLLPALWALAPGHPNLLPAYHAGDPACAALGGDYARKPLFGREGANLRLVRAGATLAESGGPYGAEGYVLQALAALPDFGGRRPVLGAWMVGDAPAGLCVREGGPITDDRALFVPHLIA